MPAYSITEVEVIDQEDARKYVQLARAAVSHHGGRYLALAATPTAVEGQWSADRRLVIIEFPSHGAAQSLSLSATDAVAFADEIAEEVCVDDNVSGIQFDYEPFNAESAGQQAFYIEIDKDFASGTYGCVDSAHPNGWYFSVFTFGAALAKDGAEIKTMLGSDGYFIVSLYNLGTNGLGIQNGTGTGAADYPALVQSAVNTTVWYADQLGIPYAFGFPAAAPPTRWSAEPSRPVPPAV